MTSSPWLAFNHSDVLSYIYILRTMTVEKSEDWSLEIHGCSSCAPTQWILKNFVSPGRRRYYKAGTRNQPILSSLQIQSDQRADRQLSSKPILKFWKLCVAFCLFNYCSNIGLWKVIDGYNTLQTQPFEYLVEYAVQFNVTCCNYFHHWVSLLFLDHVF